MFNIILAFVIAVIGWAFVVYNYYPDTDVRYNDVPIIYIGEDMLADRGYGISEVSKENLYVVLKQQRVDCGSIDAKDINVIADVSDAVEGDNGIALQISGPNGTQIKDSEVKSVSVQVERAERQEMDVLVEYFEDTEADTEPFFKDLTADTVRVTGAASLMESVDKIVAYIKTTDTNNDFRSFTRELKALDRNGDEVPHITIEPGSVTFTAKKGYLKTVDVQVNTSDRNDGYERTITAPAQIVIKGSPADLAGVDTIETEEVYIGDIYEDSERELIYILPEGVQIARDSEGDNILQIRVSEKKEEPEEDQTESTESEEGTQN